MEEEFNQPEEEKEIESFEFSLDEDEINELIAKLVELKQTRNPVSFDIDDENELMISYEEGEEDEE